MEGLLDQLMSDFLCWTEAPTSDLQSIKKTVFVVGRLILRGCLEHGGVVLSTLLLSLIRSFYWKKALGVSLPSVLYKDSS